MISARQFRARTQRRIRTVSRARSDQLLGFVMGLALGVGLFVAAAFLPAMSITSPHAAASHVDDGDFVVPLLMHDIHLARSKAALRDAPPRPLAAAPVMTSAVVPVPEPAPVTTAPGKASLMARAASDARPAIALVIDDLGIVADRSARALRLPEEVTLSFLPYGPVALTVAHAAAAQGHEILLHVPMEPEGDADPGPGALSVADSDARLRQILAVQLRDFTASVPVAGINNHMGSRATADARVMDAVMQVVEARGLAYLDSLTTPASVARAAARRAKVQFIARDVFLDPASGPDIILAQLDQLEQRARTSGVVVAIAHPHEMTLDILEVWVRGLEAKGIRLVPVTEAIRLQRIHPEEHLVASSN